MRKHKSEFLCFSFRPCASFLIGVAAVCFASCPTAIAQTWNLAWSDEFNGASDSPIDATKWGFDHGDLKVNNEVEYYCGPLGDLLNVAPCAQTPNVYVDGSGHLVIQAFRVASNTAPYSDSWTSARMKSSSLSTFQYGRIESSMKLPIGSGLWPAFWALGSNISQVSWPNCGEQDYMENVPASGGLGPGVVSSTLHGPTYFGAKGLTKRYPFPNGGQINTAFHSYGAIWSPFMVQFYMDNPTNVFFVRTANDVPGGSSQWAFNHPFFLLLNLAVGGNGSWPGPPDNSTPNPAVMLIDYVRRYTASPLTPPSLGNPAPITVEAGATTGNTRTVNLTSSSDIGRVYLSCSTTAPNASCTITSSDTLNIYTVDLNKSLATTATVAITTASNSAQAGSLRNSVGTTRGSYSITVNAYTVSNTGGAPDATANIALTVQ
jgi:beta-glucanase (GH16 family)